MGDDTNRPTEPVKPEGQEEPPVEDEVGEFISGHVLEKDSVFFEG